MMRYYYNFLMDDYSYSQKHIDKALQRIQAQLKGNHPDPSSATLSIKRNGFATINARTRFDIDAHIETRQEKGKITQGRLVEANKLDSEIKAFSAKLSQNENISQAAKDQIKTLPIQGFGAQKAVVNLPIGKEIITAHIACGGCHQQGHKQCQKCQGQGNIKCPRCFGHGELQCDVCLGSSVIQEGNTSKQCHKCFGRREVHCYQCQAKRMVPCTDCNMRGQVSCHGCNGTGFNSTVVTLTPKIQTIADIFVEDLDDDPKRMIGKIGSVNLAKGGHATVKIIQAPTANEDASEIAYYDDEDDKIDSNTVFYEMNLPWAVAQLNLNDKKYTVTFAGQKGAVCESGSFMADVLNPSVEILDKCKRGHIKARDAIQKIAHTRVSRETFEMLAKRKPAKVMQEMHKQYPLGWSKKFIQSYVMSAYTVLKRATRSTRYIGLIVGLLFSTLFYYGWFIKRLKPEFSLSYPTAYIIEGIPFVTGIIIVLIAIKGIGYFQYQSLMRQIGIRTRHMPPVGKAGLYGIIGAIILWVMFIYGQYANIY